MSMNLAFEMVGAEGMGLINFPIHTPTNLSYAIMNAPTLHEKLSLIEDHLKQWEWPQEDIDRCVEWCNRMLCNETLKLVIV